MTDLPGGLSAVVLGYRAMLAAWDEARRRAGGELGGAEESSWGSALDTVWRAFTEEELEAYEKWRLIERAAGVVKGEPADAVIDTDRIHDEG
jgi:hypothetical protein